MSLRSRLAIAVCAASVCALVLPACNHNSTYANSASTKAMADLPQPVLTNAKDYIAKLDSFNNQLDAVNGSTSALKALPSIAESVEPINKLADQLNNLSPDVKRTLTAAFGEQFTSLNNDLNANANRLLASPETASLFKSTFNNVRILEQRAGGRWQTTTASVSASRDE